MDKLAKTFDLLNRNGNKFSYTKTSCKKWIKMSLATPEQRGGERAIWDITDSYISLVLLGMV
jgi:hypothetical protein